MRLGLFGVILSVLIAGGACRTTSAEGIFTSGEAGGSGASNGGTASGTGGVFGTGGDGGSAGSFGTGGNFGSGGSGAGGTTFDADIDTGVGGTTDSGPDPDGGGDGGDGGVGGTNGASGSGGSGDGVVCAGNQCDPGRRCCFPSNGSAYCTTRGAECACTGLCTTTTMTCDSQSDCSNGDICCATVAYSVGSARVSTVRCQPSCSTTLVEYIVCDPNGPDICPGLTNCSQALLLSAIDVCQ
jgi:hypothetical protein